MKLSSFIVGQRHSYGIITWDGIVDVGARLGIEYPTLLSVIEAEAFDLLHRISEQETTDMDVDAVRFLPPIPHPDKIFCVGVNYPNRNEEYQDGSQQPKYPSLFMRTVESFVGHNEPLVRPPESEQLDYEGEIALIVGKAGRRIPQARALDHIAGITCANDGTIRDWTRHGKFNVTQGKNFDRTGSIGPWMVTLDEFDDPENLTLTTRVNGEVRQQDDTANLMFPFSYLISYISTFTTLKPGDVILTGTPTGAGVRFDPPRFLKAGDIIDIQVSGVGALVNEVQDET